MVLSVSTRCDIPAFYFDWFLKRMDEGFVDIRNPFHPKLVSRIMIDPSKIDCIIFYTKNPIPMVDNMSRLNEYHYYIHITVNGYGPEIEPNIPDKKKIIEAIINLSKKVGKEKITLRYNPIFLSQKYTIYYHIKAFEKLCRLLHPYVDRVIIGFLDLYKNTLFHQLECQFVKPSFEEEQYIAASFGLIAKQYELTIQTCIRHENFSDYGFIIDACNSSQYVNQQTGKAKKYRKTKVRKECGCIESADIGAYNSCNHLCKYCYANFDEKNIFHKQIQHDPNSSLLFGTLQEEDLIKIRS